MAKYDKVGPMSKCFYLLIFFLSSVTATEYLMPQLVLKKALIDQSQIIQKSHQCHEMPAPQNSQDLGEQGFLATITCRFSCNGEAIKEQVVKENFQTKDQNMNRGDGALWAGLASTLQMWSGEICMNAAQQDCGSLKNISKFETPAISSGNWNWNEKLSCQKKASSIISPFDQSIKTDKVKLENVTSKPLALEIKTSWLKPRKELSHTQNEYVMPKDCKKQISGTFCYGDCVALDGGPLKELLSGPESLGSDNYSLCADDLIEKIKNKNLASDVVNFYCEDYFISTLKNFNAGGWSCAAARATVDCSQLK
jgi:hypothetical protein